MQNWRHEYLSWVQNKLNIWDWLKTKPKQTWDKVMTRPLNHKQTIAQCYTLPLPVLLNYSWLTAEKPLRSAMRTTSDTGETKNSNTRGWPLRPRQVRVKTPMRPIQVWQNRKKVRFETKTRPEHNWPGSNCEFTDLTVKRGELFTLCHPFVYFRKYGGSFHS